MIQRKNIFVVIIQQTSVYCHTKKYLFLMQISIVDVGLVPLKNENFNLYKTTDSNEQYVCSYVLYVHSYVFPIVDF